MLLSASLRAKCERGCACFTQAYTWISVYARVGVCLWIFIAYCLFICMYVFASGSMCVSVFVVTFIFLCELVYLCAFVFLCLWGLRYICVCVHVCVPPHNPSKAEWAISPSLCGPGLPLCPLRLELCLRCTPGFSWDSDTVTFEKGTFQRIRLTPTQWYISLMARMSENERYKENHQGVNEMCHTLWLHSRHENRQRWCVSDSTDHTYPAVMGPSTNVSYTECWQHGERVGLL